jgi:hypothetical protein
MLVVVGHVLAQDPPQMGLVPDEGVIQELAAASPIQRSAIAFIRGPHVAEHGPDPGADEDGVERGGEVGTAIADHELDLMCLVAEVHDQVACLLGGPFPGRVQGDAKDSDAPARVLYYGQDVGLGPVEQVGCEEVACQDCAGLRTQELRPGRPDPS